MEALSKRLQGPIVDALTDSLHNAPVAEVLRAAALKLEGVEDAASRTPFSSRKELDEHRVQHCDALEEALVRAITEVLMQGPQPGVDPVQSVTALLRKDARPALGHKVSSMDLYHITGEEYDELKADWATLDASHSGTLSLEDIKQLLGPGASEVDVEAMMARFDPDGDGSVTFDEYVRALCLNEPASPSRQSTEGGEEIRGAARSRWVRAITEVLMQARQPGSQTQRPHPQDGPDETRRG